MDSAVRERELEAARVHETMMAYKTKAAATTPRLPPQQLAFMDGGGSVAGGGGASVFTSVNMSSATTRPRPVPGCTTRPSKHHIALSQARVVEKQGTRALNDGLALLLQANSLTKDGRYFMALPIYEEVSTQEVAAI
jgi:hypothetical protein